MPFNDDLRGQPFSDPPVNISIYPEGAAVLYEEQFEPGATLELRGRHDRLRINQRGDLNNPIRIVCAEGDEEWGNIDGGENTGPPIIDLMDSRHVHLIGLHITSSGKRRTDPDETGRHKAIEGGGIGCKVINCVLYNTGGIGGGPFEAYGNLLYACGGNTQEHGIYWQNDGEDPKLIESNIIINPSGYGLHLFGSEGELVGFHVIANTIVNPGLVEGNMQSSILVGGGQPVDMVSITDNAIYQMPEVAQGSGIRLGYKHEQNMALEVLRNTIVANNGIKVDKPFRALTVSNNHTTADNYCMVWEGDWTPSWEYNAVATRRGDGAVYRRNTGEGREEWTAVMAEEAGIDPDIGTRVITRPNKYDPDRLDVIVFNPEGHASVDVNLGHWLKDFDKIEIRRADNYYESASEAMFMGDPLGLNMRHGIVARVAGYPKTPNTWPQFGVFILRRIVDDTVPPEPPDPPEVPEGRLIPIDASKIIGIMVRE